MGLMVWFSIWALIWMGLLESSTPEHDAAISRLDRRRGLAAVSFFPSAVPSPAFRAPPPRPRCPPESSPLWSPAAQSNSVVRPSPPPPTSLIRHGGCDCVLPSLPCWRIMVFHTLLEILQIFSNWITDSVIKEDDSRALGHDLTICKAALKKNS